jgi:pimeloyl-ACP methyl ester carboxylesterase
LESCDVRTLKRALALAVLAAVLLAGLPTYSYAAAPSDSGRYPVIVVPGIAGTELYNKNELVWLNTWKLLGSQVPILNLFQMSWLLPLRLGADGQTPYYKNNEVHTGDILRQGITNIYGGLIGSLKQDGYTEGKDLFLFPYDWRQDLDTSAAQLAHKVDDVLARTKASKVVLVSHSMGGLVARDYVVRGGAPKVKATISLATPWLGAPMAYRALEYGWDLGLKLPGTKWSALGPKDVKLLAQNYPSVYELAPSRHYFDVYPNGYLTRAGHAFTYTETVNQALAPHNQVLASRRPQEALLDGSNHGVLQFVAAGTGRSTLGAVTERRGLLGVTQKTESTIDGDEVVPLYSADLGYSKDPHLPQQFIGKVEAVAYADQAHTFFTQSAQVQTDVKQWLEM